MAKRRLSKQQQRRILEKQQRHISRSEQDEEPTGDIVLGQEQEGLVIANYGKQLIVETESRGLVSCLARPTLQSVVCGDRVIWQPIEEADRGIIVAIQPRRSLLERPGFAGKVKPVAANIDSMLVVTAPLPELNEGMLDRYLISAEAIGIEARIVFNKLDLLDETSRGEYESRLDVYRRLGYPVLHTSTKLAHGMDELLEALQGRTSILVGQSGVGKSSLVSLLLPHEEIRIGDISLASHKGGHTTTTARLYHLDCGGDLIDSPGVREFGLVRIEEDMLADCFREFREYSDRCRFRDCNHRDSEDCAVIEAVAQGDIDQRRYQSYLRILESLQQGNR